MSGFVRNSAPVSSLVTQVTKLTDDKGSMSNEWYRYYQDLHQYSGLAKQNFPLYQDLTAPASSLIASVSNPATRTTVGVIDVWSMSASATNAVQFTLQLPHGYVEGTELRPFIMWSPSDSNIGNVMWQIDYIWASIDDVLPTPVTITQMDAPPASTRLLRTEFMDGTSVLKIDGSEQRFSSVITGRAARMGASVDDTYPSAVYFLAIGFHFLNAAHGTPKVWSET